MLCLNKVKYAKIKFRFVAVLVLVVCLFLLYITVYISLKRLKPKKYEVSQAILPYVVVHIDFKGSPPKLRYLQSLLPMLKQHGANGLLMEYEDMFPYEGKLVNISSRNAYSRSELKNFLITAVHNGFETIPLVQTFGHMEHVLKLREFRHLREVPVFPDSICPSKIESKDVIRHMLKQVVNFHNSVSPLKHIHVGCDEVYHINNCEQCVSKGSANHELFIEHIRYISSVIADFNSNLTMLIWDDMLRTIKPLEQNEIDCFNNIEPVYWDYEPKPRFSHYNLLFYKKKFNNVWAASAFKGADGRSATFPDLNMRVMNHYSWLKFMQNLEISNKRFDFTGIILTGWSRYSHMDPACELLPVSIPSLIINLHIIKEFRHGVVGNNFSEFEIIFTSPKPLFEHCYTNHHNNKIECTFGNIELHDILKQYLDVKNNMMEKLYSDEKNGLYSVEYYSKSKYVNMNTLLTNVQWCNDSLKNINIIEGKMVKSMKLYFNDDFVYEYVDLMTLKIKNQLKGLLEALYSNLHNRIWERRP